MRKKVYINFKNWLLLVVLALAVNYSYAQQTPIKVTGKVTDLGKAPLVGVSVMVKGSSTGTQTNSEGNFNIQASPAATLVFTYVGFDAQEAKVPSSGVINITMSGDKVLDQLVVVGYGTAKKKDLTGGLAVVGKEQLGMVSTPNLMDRLVGQVAGFNITTSNAAPGQDQSLLIRGENSLSANNSPLIVLDGIPYSGSLVDIDPNNVENLTVLKDASAVAIYGSRGSNGVILIQTKRGMLGKPQVSYRGQLGVAEPMQRIDVMGPNEFIRFQQDIGRLREGYTGDQLDPVAGNIISVTERGNYVKGITNDWQSYIFRKAITTDHQLSISGGTESTKYMAAVAALKQDGVVYNSTLTRLNMTANIDQTFNKWLTIGVGTQYTQRSDGGVQPNIEHAIKQSPYGSYKDAAGYYVPEPMEYSLIVNPMRNVNADQDRINRNFFLSTYANIQLPLKGLSARTNFGYNYRSGFTGTYYGRDTFDGREQAGLVGGRASISNSHYNDYTWENILKYERQIGDHRFDATGLFSVQQTKSVGSSQSAEGFVTDDTSYFMMNTAARNITNTSSLSETALLSYMGRLNYGYKGRYIATFTGRSDGASVFGVNNKYAFFPSAALAWHIGEESFLKNKVNWLGMLKLRLSYGANGNQAITPYRTLDRLYSSVKYIWGDGGTAVNTAYLAGDGVGNPNLKWETTYTGNIGIDFQLFNNRVSGSVDMYRSRTKDLLMTRTVPIMNGYSRIWDNVGETQNQGLEVTLNTTNISHKDFKWNSTVVFSFDRDKIIELRGDGLDDINNNWFIGKPLRVFYDYNMVGIWQRGDQFFYTDASENQREAQTGAAPGSAKLQDVDGNGFINTSDRKIIGSKMPRYTASLANRVSYKNFYMSALATGTFGVWRDDNMANLGSWTFGITNYVHNANYWTPENPEATIVSPGYNNTFGHGFYKKVNYVQIRNVTFGYKLNTNFARKLGVSAVDMNLSVNNLYTFSNIRQVLNYDNTWMASYPTARLLVFGLNVNF
ncbi:SusC/RagA family TonB-linked outer membrane protein [Mucilaginibacter terrae]|uniref:TonB-linked SusC/RagA family outer membrane protein n=1 Tax=Mucilaginibacter terrae TaxID=1955052 RepID=A0ABU3GQH8_9SPHI|nr:TonB-dependent receptor [Mucilaginibacter terrae]MDT3402039.1 TonB-linked SusC/RagA family outer membrane protein [Mucilaginibacter terrae]